MNPKLVNQVLCGDSLQILPTWPENCIDTVLTDPPYALGFIGKDWDTIKETGSGPHRPCFAGGSPSQTRSIAFGVPAHQTESNNRDGGWGFGGMPGAVSKQFYRAGLAFEQWCTAWAAAALRVAKPGALLLAFGGTRTFHRLACGIEDAGWEIRDCIMYCYGSGFPKGNDISAAIDKAAGAQRTKVGEIHKSPVRGVAYAQDTWTAENMGVVPVTEPATAGAKLWEGWNTTLKPAWEPIIVAMKPCDGTYAANALKWGVAGFNIDGARIPTEGGVVRTRQGQSVSQQAGDMYAGRDQRDGAVFESHRLGRWPANLIHDGSDEVLPLFPETASGAFSGHRNEPKWQAQHGETDPHC